MTTFRVILKALANVLTDLEQLFRKNWYLLGVKTGFWYNLLVPCKISDNQLVNFVWESPRTRTRNKGNSEQEVQTPPPPPSSCLLSVTQDTFS